MKPKIILASESQRRSAILKECGIAHTVIKSGVKETMQPQKGADYNALVNAIRKAHAVAHNQTSGFVIGADTLVSLGKRVIGKPKNKNQARWLLRDFSGKTIKVFTGLCVINAYNKKSAQKLDCSIVKVKKIPTEKISAYLKALGPADKAGGFSIEGAGSFLFDNIKGSFYNVLGLPMITLYELFEKLGVDLLEYRKR